MAYKRLVPSYNWCFFPPSWELLAVVRIWVREDTVLDQSLRVGGRRMDWVLSRLPP